jgi:RHS repeat-associated protein
VSLKWLLYDGHGNLVRTMAPDYALSGFQWRGVWGEVQGVLGAGRGYCANLGHPEDETGLVYMRARYYEPATGRFISEDPDGYGENWYLYADGNPVSKLDPDGRAVYIDFNGYWIRLDHPYHQEGTGKDIQDLTWGTWEGGQRVPRGSIRPDGSVKHGKPMPKKLIKLINGDPNTLRKLMKRGGYGLTAMVLLCSLDAAFLSDPCGFADIVDIIGGEWNLFVGAIRVSKACD